MPKSPRRWQLEIANRQGRPIPRAQMARALETVLATSSYGEAEVSVAVVSDAEMRRLNRQYLQHDYPTDVLSFVLERDRRRGSLHGEIVVSADMAARVAKRLGGTYRNELLLYLVHGGLHLVGFQDDTQRSRRQMRRAEAAIFAELGWRLPRSIDAPESASDGRTT